MYDKFIYLNLDYLKKKIAINERNYKRVNIH